MKNRGNIWSIIGLITIMGFFVIGCGKKTDADTEINLEIRDLSEFAHILEEYRDGVLANRNGEKMRTQIMTFSFIEGNRAYFCTTSDKPLYSQLVAFPYVSYCTFPDDFEPVLSLNGNVVFVEDRVLKERALDSNYYAKRNFKDADNPLLRVFYIDVEEIETYSFEGTSVYAAKK